MLEVLADADAQYQWLRQNILPLCRQWCNHWPKIGLVFGVDGPGKLFQLNEADDFVYFGKAAARDGKVNVTRGIWNGAASGQGVFKLVVESTKEVGGFHVNKVS